MWVVGTLLVVNARQTTGGQLQAFVNTLALQANQPFGLAAVQLLGHNFRHQRGHHPAVGADAAGHLVQPLG